MKKKNILIMGISGQDGSYLADYLLKKKNYSIYGISRKNKKIKNHIQLGIDKKIKMKCMKYDNYIGLKNIIMKKNISEIYFFAGQTKPVLSNLNFLETIYSNLIPVYNIIDIILNYKKEVRFFNASSCEIFASNNKILNENSLKDPQTIYGLSKLITLEMVKFFREKYNLKICSGILFHHESILRDKSFVLRKIILAAKKIKEGKQKKIKLGNIEVSRDWGWAPEYVKIIHKINNQKIIEDLIVASGFTVSLKILINEVFLKYNLNWKNFIHLDKSLLRDKDVIVKNANNLKIKNKLRWKPKYNAFDVVNRLMREKLH